MSNTITPAEAKKLADETLAFLLDLTEKTEGAERAAEIIKTEQARRAAVAAAKEAERAARTLIFEGFEVTLVEVDKASRPGTKARVYTWGLETPILKALEDALQAHGAPKTRGEDKEQDRAYDRYNRAYRKEAIGLAARVVPALVAAGMLSRSDMPFSAKYSKTAGCSCPCSPGVVLSHALYGAGSSYQRYDVHISPVKQA